MESTAVDAMEIAGTVAPHDLSLISLFLHANFIVKLVIFALFFSSFWSWKIIFDKWTMLKTSRAKAAKFEKGFWDSNDIDEWYRRTIQKANHPLARVFAAGMQEWYASKGTNLARLSHEARDAIRARVAQLMMVARNREVDEMEKSLGFLATVGSTAPFVGLFGTVWGIMDSFQSIAAEKSTNLTVVAPGIAEALFATAVGLLAAIPAVIAYNKLSAAVGRFAGVMEDFSNEFDAMLSRQFDEAAREK